MPNNDLSNQQSPFPLFSSATLTPPFVRMVLEFSVNNSLALSTGCTYAFFPTSQDLRDSPSSSDPPPCHHLALSPAQTTLLPRSERRRNGGDPIRRQFLQFSVKPLPRSFRITLSPLQFPEMVCIGSLSVYFLFFFPFPLTPICREYLYRLPR